MSEDRVEEPEAEITRWGRDNRTEVERAYIELMDGHEHKDVLSREDLHLSYTRLFDNPRINRATIAISKCHPRTTFRPTFWA
jgi:hypothetical protein